MSQRVQRGGQPRSPGHLAIMRGYAALLVPVILVVVAATDVPTTVVMATTAAPHDVTTVQHPIPATSPETTAGATHQALPVTTVQHPIPATSPETTAGATHQALPVTLPHLITTTSLAAKPGATHRGLPGRSEVTTSRTQHGETGRSEVTTSGAQHGDTDTPAKPEIRLGVMPKNILVVSCFSASKIPNIEYELIQDSNVVQNMTLHTNQPANFTIQMPGAMKLQCRARNPFGREALSIVQNVSVDKGNRDVRFGPTVQRGVSVHPLDAAVKVNKTEATDGEETDNDQEDRKNRAAILKAVFQAVEKMSILILCICGPTLLLVLLVIICVTYKRNRREPKVMLIYSL